MDSPLKRWRLNLKPPTLEYAAEVLTKLRGAPLYPSQLCAWEKHGRISKGMKHELERITKGKVKASDWPEPKTSKKKIAKRSAAKLVQASETVRAASKRLHLHTDAALADGVLTDDEMTRLSSDRDDLDRAEREFDSACGVCSDG